MKNIAEIELVDELIAGLTIDQTKILLNKIFRHLLWECENANKMAENGYKPTEYYEYISGNCRLQASKIRNFILMEAEGIQDTGNINPILFKRLLNF